MLVLELNRAPHMFTNVSKSNPVWEPTGDFTGGEAFRYRYHFVYFNPSQVNLENHYHKLTLCDSINEACGRQINIDPRDTHYHNFSCLGPPGLIPIPSFGTFYLFNLTYIRKNKQFSNDRTCIYESIFE